MIRSTFALPLLLAVLSLAGLVLALTGEGWRDWLSWALLAAPLVAVARSAARSRERKTR